MIYINQNQKVYLNYIILFLIILCAAYTRFYNVFDRGIWDFDGANYANSAISIYLIPKWIYLNYDNYDSFNILFKEMGNFIGDSGGSNYFSKHPAHIFLIFISFILFGVNDYSIHIMNSLIGVVTIIFLFYLAKRFFNIKIALIACCFLAVSSNHLFFSRLIGVQVGLVLFSLISSYYFLESHKSPELTRKIWISGFIFGFALMIHKAVGLLLITFIIIEWLYKKNYRDLIHRVSILCIPSFLIFILYEGVLSIYSNFLGNSLNVEMTARSSSNLIVTLSHLKTVVLRGYSGLDQIFSHTQGIYLKEGILCLLLFIIGVFLIFLRIKKYDNNKKYSFNSLKYSFILIGFLLPFIFWSLFSGETGTTKAFQFALPYFFITSGIGFDMVTKKFIARDIYRNIAFVFFIVLSLVIGINRNLDLIVLENGYKETVLKTTEYIKNNGGVVNLESGNTYYNPMISFYLSKVYRQGDNNINKHIILDGKKSQTMGNDYIFWHWLFLHVPYRFSNELELINNCDPIITIENSMGKIPPIFWTNRNKTRLERLNRIQKDDRIDKIFVYDLRKCD